jgi:hypothetical protein
MKISKSLATLTDRRRTFRLQWHSAGATAAERVDSPQKKDADLSVRAAQYNYSLRCNACGDNPFK